MTTNHLVITDVGFWSNPAHASSVVKVLAMAGQATPPGRSIKRMLLLRYAVHLIWIGGICGRRARADWAKAIPTRKGSSQAIVGATGVRATAWGEGIGRVNWGPSAAGGLFPQLPGIIHNPWSGRQKRRWGHSKQRSGRTLQPAGEPRTPGPVVKARSLRCRLDASPTTEITPRNETDTVAAYKRTAPGARRWPRREAGLKPYWGKPAVRNFRGGGRNETHGLMAFCHDAPKG
jgi:hypothetical protein